MKNSVLLLTITIIIIAASSVAQETGTFTDSRDKKVYKTVKIGTQTWMAENLNYNASGSWCYGNDSIKYDAYGHLYKFDDAKNVCPTGWHLPSDADWTTLIDSLGGEDIAGGKLKSTLSWTSPNFGATNSSGFTALAAGNFGVGKFKSIGIIGAWWSSTEYSKENAWYWGMYYDNSGAYKYNNYKYYGFSVRCVKD